MNYVIYNEYNTKYVNIYTKYILFINLNYSYISVYIQKY